MLRVGIVGLGTISYIHQIAIEQSGLAQLVAVCDTNPKTQQDYSDFAFYTDLEEMLQKEQLDVVHVCLPHDLHKVATETIVKHGVHVFLEKPIGTSYREAFELWEAVKESPAKVGVSFQNRYNNTSQKLYELIQDEEVVAVKGIVTWFRPESYYQAQPWRGQLDRAGGGVIINQAIHTLDLMHYIAGKIESGRAVLSNLLDYDIEVEDTATARFVFENGATGLFMATNAHIENSPIELQVITKHNKYIIKGTRLYSYDEDDVLTLLAEDEKLDGYKSYYGQGHKLCVKHLYRAIIDNTDDYVSIDAALETMLMVSLMQKSSQEDREVKAKELRK